MQIGVANGNSSFAQLTLSNPSFEDKISWFNKINGWDSCPYFYYVASIPTPYIFFSPPPPPNGILYGAIGTSGDFTQKQSFLTNRLSCKVKKNMSHKLSLWAMGYFYHGGGAVKHGLGYFTVHLGYTACDSNQLIYQSPIMYDTLQWYNYEFEFSPNDDFEYIGILAHQALNGGVTDILIDNFSPITVEIPNTAHIQVNNINGNCYGLQCGIDNNIEAVRYEWRNQSAVISNQSAVNNICIDNPTTIYLTAWDKCGYAYVDSFRFTSTSLQYQYNSNTSSLNISLVPFDKPVQLQLYNDVGQLVNFAELSSQTTTYQFNLSNLTSGIYFLTLVSDKRITKQKIWKY